MMAKAGQRSQAPAVQEAGPHTPQSRMKMFNQKAAALVKAAAFSLREQDRAPFVQRLMQSLMVAHTRNPKLYNCTDLSVMQAAIFCAKLGLDCAGSIPEAVLVPFGAECVPMVEYRGMVKLAKRNGIVDVEAHEVCKGDVYERQRGTESFLKHVPLDPNRTPENITHFYVLMEEQNGKVRWDEMTIGEVKKVEAGVRARARGQDVPAWDQWFERQGCKTVTKRGLKIRIIYNDAPALAEALRLDDRAEGGQMSLEDVVEGLDLTPAEVLDVETLPTQAERIKGKVKIDEKPQRPTDAKSEPPPAKPQEKPLSNDDKARLEIMTHLAAREDGWTILRSVTQDEDINGPDDIKKALDSYGTKKLSEILDAVIAATS